MMTMKRIARIFGLLLLGAGFATKAEAQEIRAFTASLSRPDSVSHATVSVTPYGSAVQALDRYDRSAKPATVQGYRIRIFFDNGQNARADAMATQERFRREFPGIPTYLGYETPSYMVTVGNCISMDEALILWNRVRHSFHTAFLWRGKIPVSEILRIEETLPAEEMPTDSLGNNNTLKENLLNTVQF